MDRIEMYRNNNKIRERFADMAHGAWSDWMTYLFSCCDSLPDGSTVIPPDAKARWLKKMNTPYTMLTMEEQASDLVQADKYLAALDKELSCG